MCTKCMAADKLGTPFKPSDADLLSNIGNSFLDNGGHRFGGVLDERLLQQRLLRHKLLNPAIHNLGSAMQQAHAACSGACSTHAENVH